MAAVVFFRGQRAWAFPIVIAAVFAAVHLWQGRESPAARLAAQIEGRQPLVEATGIVCSEPRVFSEKFASFELQLRHLRIDGNDATAPITILVEWPGPPPTYGDEIRAIGTLGAVERPRNPGQFDFAAWSARRGIYSNLVIAHGNDASILAHGRGNPLVALALRVRDGMKSTLTAGIDDPMVSDLLVAMVLGDSSDLPERIQEEFRGTGTFHLFSVSGLHVGMLAVLLWALLRTFRVPRRQAALIVIPVLFFYALMTGLKPASVRSVVMATIVIAGFLADRRPVLLNNLLAAGFLILLWDTNQLFNAGCQLSFSVVAMILLFSGPLTRRLEKYFQPDPFFPRKLLSPLRRAGVAGGEKFASLAAVSIAAWLGSLPLTLGYFHLVSLTALPANLLAVPISFGIMAVAMISILTGLVSTWTAVVFNQLNWALSKLLLGVIHVFAILPGSFFYVGPPAPQNLEAEIVVFDFGAGGAACLSSGGETWLIDCGPVRHFDSVLLPFLRSRGLRSLDGLVLTHGDAGHIGAASEILRSCPPRLIVDSPLEDHSPSRSRFHAELASQGHPKALRRAGDSFAIGRVRAHVLYPPLGLPGRVADDKALVLRVDAGSTRLLFLSDASLAAEQWLLTHAPHELSADILVKGHPRHGPSAGSAFLRAVDPEVVVTSREEFAPHESAAVFPPDIRQFDQERCGAVIIKIHSRHFAVSGFLDRRQYSCAR